MLRSSRSSSGALRLFIHVIYFTFLFARIHKRRHAILWWSEEAVSVSSFIHFTANLTSSRLPFRIVVLVQNVGLLPVKDEKQAPFAVALCVRKSDLAGEEVTDKNLPFESAGETRLSLPPVRRSSLILGVLILCHPLQRFFSKLIQEHKNQRAPPRYSPLLFSPDTPTISSRYRDL